MSFDEDELPEFARWRSGFKGGRPVSLWDYAAHHGGATLAIAFASLFWPRLIDVSGCVVLVERYDAASFREWQAKFGDDRRAIEEIVNHVHLWDLFSSETEEVPDAQVEQLARTMARTWEMALADQFPERDPEVIFSCDHESYGPMLTLTTHPRTP